MPPQMPATRTAVCVPAAAHHHRRQAARSRRARVVVAVLLLDPVRVLRHPADPRRNRRGRRRREPAVAVHRHAGRDADREPAVLGARHAPCAGALHLLDLPVLHGEPADLLHPAGDDIRADESVDGPRLLRLGGGVQPVRGFGVLGVACRRVQQRAKPAAVRVHRRGRHDRRHSRIVVDVIAGRASGPQPAADRFDRAARNRGVQRPPAGEDLAWPAASGARSAAETVRSAAACCRDSPTPSSRRTC